MKYILFILVGLVLGIPVGRWSCSKHDHKNLIIFSKNDISVEYHGGYASINIPERLRDKIVVQDVKKGFIFLIIDKKKFPIHSPAGNFEADLVVKEFRNNVWKDQHGCIWLGGGVKVGDILKSVSISWNNFDNLEGNSIVTFKYNKRDYISLGIESTFKLKKSK